MVVKEMIVEGPIVERFATEKTVVQGSVAEKTVKKMEVDSPLVKLLRVEDLQQASYSVVHCFSISVIAILVLMCWAEVIQKHIPVKNKNISKKKKTNKKQIRYC